MLWMIIIHDMSNQVAMAKIGPPAVGNRCRKLGAEKDSRKHLPTSLALTAPYVAPQQKIMSIID
jgi:hypothetical protein